jgi:hypothetical protein
VLDEARNVALVFHDDYTRRCHTVSLAVDVFARVTDVLNACY